MNCSCQSIGLIKVLSALYLRDVRRSQTHVARRGSGDMAISNLFWRNVEIVSATPPLYLNFYRKLAMIAKPSIGKGG